MVRAAAVAVLLLPAGADKGTCTKPSVVRPGAGTHAIPPALARRKS